MSASDGAFAGSVDAATLFAESARSAGIEVTVSREPADGYWSEVWNTKPFVACYWFGRLTEDWMFSQAYQSDASANDTRFSHERFDSLLIAARAELDDAKRREMYGEMQQIMRDEGGTIVPAYAQFVMGLTDKVQHAPDVSAAFELDGYRAVNRWWFG